MPARRCLWPADVLVVVVVVVTVGVLARRSPNMRIDLGAQVEAYEGPLTCFNCGLAGHLGVYCHDRRLSTAMRPPSCVPDCSLLCWGRGWDAH